MNRMNRKTCDGIIFDLDGTLWDATYVLTDSWNQAYKNVNPLGTHMVTRKELCDCMGLLIPDIAAKLYPEHNKEMQLAIMEQAIAIEGQMLLEKGGKLYPDMKETLCKLKDEGYSLFVVSNCQAGYIETFIKAHHLEGIFFDIECPGNTGLLKADNIKLVVERNHLEMPVYVGDTITDATAAHTAGVPFIHAAYGFGTVEKCEGSVSSLKELPTLIKAVF